MLRRLIFAATFCLILGPLTAHAEIFTLQNGDHLTGKVIQETKDTLWIQHEILGRLEIGRDRLAAPVSAEPAKDTDSRVKGEVLWERKIGGGLEIARGNTDKELINGDLSINRNRRWVDEWTVKAGAAASTVNHRKEKQKADGSIRYGRSFNKKAYHFYRIGAEHDFLENVKARVIPTAGVGYWFYDKDALKSMVEAGAGYEYEWLRPEGRDGRPVGHGRFMVMKKIGDKGETGFDLYYFPQLTDFGNWRLQGEAYASAAMTEHLSLKVTLKDQYRSRPVKEAKKNDLSLVSGVEVNF